MKALVIDDSRAMRTIIAKILRDVGFEVRDAANGLEGLDQLGGGDLPDLLLVDWNMPEMNGLQFVDAVRSRPEFDNIRIMMVTTETDRYRMVEALERGADEYVMKPFTGDVIKQKLEQIGMAVA